MIITAHQPAYLPWLGYLHKIALSDIFILLDDVQFEKNSFANRNKVWSHNGDVMLTVPLLMKGHVGKPLRAMEINNSEHWAKKHWKTIEQNYRKAPFFSHFAPWLETIYSQEWNTLVELTDVMLAFFMKELGISTRFVRQSELGIVSHKQDLVFDLCKETGATAYVSGKLGKNYLDTQPFSDAGIKIYFQDYVHPIYTQFGKANFVPYLGIVDLLMNVTPEEVLDVIFKCNDRKLEI